MNTASTFSFAIVLAASFMAGALQPGASPEHAPQGTTAAAGHRVIEILADKDSRFKVGGSDRTPLVLTAGEAVTLRITAVRAKEADRDGSVHGFVLLDKNGNKVPGWSFPLKPGTSEFQVTAPAAGDYAAICNVICSADHEHMRLKVKILPSATSAKE